MKSSKSPTLREQIVNRLGAVCVRCGFKDDIRVLHIDHIHNNGKRERAEHGGRIYEWIANNLNSGYYQVLCANCNMLKQLDHCQERRKPTTFKMLKESFAQISDAQILFLWWPDARTRRIERDGITYHEGRFEVLPPDDFSVTGHMIFVADDCSFGRPKRSPDFLGHTFEDLQQYTGTHAEQFEEIFKLALRKRETQRIVAEFMH